MPTALGLYLQVSLRAARKAVVVPLHARWRGRGRWGSAQTHTVTLAMAREKGHGMPAPSSCDELDPIESRKAARQATRARGSQDADIQGVAPANTSRLRRLRMEEHQARRAVGEHPRRLRLSGARRAFGPGVDTALVLKVLEPIWTAKPETASRVRGRIESVLDWAAARGYRQGENPARWRGHLDKLLPARSKVARVQHHPALPYAETAGLSWRRCGRGGVRPAGAGVRHPHGSADRRGSRRALDRDRLNAKSGSFPASA